ncbi:HNH endonuclease [Deinococcus hopiensis]|uniref:HNH endonuclease n=1 Tax=Deinococcus hopiensis KR-140 TaxID=695939 RepID=A0A1W1VJ65_9DEIO|nr:HNH endonuclease [Deinococcus hopiensis]SMB93270.1 HNH endonuclease [Deinococcus hopiensis KR-140]
MLRSNDAYRSKHKRRAVKYGARGSFDKWDVQMRLDKQKGLCHYCGEKLDWVGKRKYQVDHFVPLSRGGSNFMSNIVLACPECNREKADKFPWEFRPARFEVGCKRDS